MGLGEKFEIDLYLINRNMPLDFHKMNTVDIYNNTHKH